MEYLDWHDREVFKIGQFVPTQHRSLHVWPALTG